MSGEVMERDAVLSKDGLYRYRLTRTWNPGVQRLVHADVLHHLGLTKAGAPKHPLYLPGDTPLTRWEPTS